MTIRITDKNYWRSFVEKTEGNIFQSYSWVEAMEKNGLSPLFFIIEDGSRPVGGVVLYQKSYRSSILKKATEYFMSSFVVMGKPIIRDKAREKEILSFLLETIDKEAKKRKIVSIDWSTNYTLMEKHRNLFRERGYKIIPFGTYILSLEVRPENLWASLHKNKRRDIRVATRNNITVQRSDNLDDYLSLHEFICKKLAYPTEIVSKQIKNIWHFLKNEGLCEVFLASNGGKLEAGAFVLVYGDTAFYLYGASVPKTKSCAAHLLLWETIKRLQKNGIKYFDFGGARPNSSSGVDEFKKRYGGKFLSRYGAIKIYKPFRYSLISKIATLKRKVHF